MKPDSMSSDPLSFDPHERARRMISWSSPDGCSHADRTWLTAHLLSCPSCQEFAEDSQETIRLLRGISITAGANLVSSTRMRVRQRVAELQRQQERFWVVCVCCAAVTLSTSIAAAVLWRGFAWMGQQARLPAPVWEGGFAVLYLLPAVLVGIFLLARGTHLADHHDSSQRWSS